MVFERLCKTWEGVGRSELLLEVPSNRINAEFSARIRTRGKNGKEWGIVQVLLKNVGLPTLFPNDEGGAGGVALLGGAVPEDAVGGKRTLAGGALGGEDVQSV